jgi:hypothetical protein
MAKTPSQIEGTRTAITVPREELPYLTELAKSAASLPGAMTLCFKDCRTFMDLSVDQVQLLKADADKRGISQRDYQRSVMSDAAFSLRKAGAAEDGVEVPDYEPSDDDKDLRTSIKIPIEELHYLSALAKLKGTQQAAMTLCFRDCRTFFDATATDIVLLRHEAARLRLSQRDYQRTLFADRAFQLRVQAESSPKSKR